MEKARHIPALGYFPETWSVHFWLYFKKCPYWINIYNLYWHIFCGKYDFVSLNQILRIIINKMYKMICMYVCVHVLLCI